MATKHYAKEEKGVKNEEAKLLIGTEFSRPDEKSYFLSQERYVTELASRAGVVKDGARYPKTPLPRELPTELDCWDDKLGKNPYISEYMSLQGGLVWAARMPRRDVSFAASYLATYQ